MSYDFAAAFTCCCWYWVCNFCRTSLWDSCFFSISFIKPSCLFLKEEETSSKATLHENLSLGVRDQVRHKPTWAAIETSYSLEILGTETRDIILSRQWITKMLIRLCGCTGYLRLFFFVYSLNRFSHDMAHFIHCMPVTTAGNVVPMIDYNRNLDAFNFHDRWSVRVFIVD